MKFTQVQPSLRGRDMPGGTWREVAQLQITFADGQSHLIPMSLPDLVRMLHQATLALARHENVDLTR